MTRLVPADRHTRHDWDARFALDVHYYLSQDPRQLPSRYFYDELGSCLFEAICRLPWYPITRAEMRLLARHRRDIIAAAQPLRRIVELGCGSGEKLLTLVGGRRSGGCELELHLIDVSARALDESVRTLSSLDGVRIAAHQAAYEAGLAELGAAPVAEGRTLTVFLGSNLGNFDPPGAEEFLREIRASLRPGDLFLLGADLVKPAPQLLLAYDDPLGVTAAFNRNLLVRINRELQGNFDIDRFAHLARWVPAESRVEMHLVSWGAQQIHIQAADLEFTLQGGETIWTESSYKYECAGLTRMLDRAAFVCKSQWVDDESRFALTLAQAV